MNAEELREFCLTLKATEEGFPFGEETLVFKVGGKIFLLMGLDERPLRFNAKCEPRLAEELRENFSCVLPGYHMNKKHWNTIVCDGSVSKKKLQEWVVHSYELVRDSLPKKIKEEILKS